jgi:hypothetical protein
MEHSKLALISQTGADAEAIYGFTCQDRVVVAFAGSGRIDI